MVDATVSGWTNLVDRIGVEPIRRGLQIDSALRCTAQILVLYERLDSRLISRLVLRINRPIVDGDKEQILLVPLERIELPHPDYKTGPLPLRIKGRNTTEYQFPY